MAHSIIHTCVCVCVFLKGLFWGSWVFRPIQRMILYVFCMLKKRSFLATRGYFPLRPLTHNSVFAPTGCAPVCCNSCSLLTSCSDELATHARTAMAVVALVVMGGGWVTRMLSPSGAGRHYADRFWLAVQVQPASVCVLDKQLESLFTNTSSQKLSGADL